MVEVSSENKQTGHTIVCSGRGSPLPGGGDGGNVEIEQRPPGKPGDIIFRLGDTTEVMRFNGDGTVFVRGEQVDSNREVYMAFRWWLSNAKMTWTVDE